MYKMEFPFKPFNSDQLHLELKAALEVIEAVSSGLGKLWVMFPSDTDNPEQYRDQVQVVIDAHDPAVLTAEQQIRQEAETTRSSLVDIIAARIAWHEANPVTSANAVEVAGRIQTEVIYIMRWIRKDLI